MEENLQSTIETEPAAENAAAPPRKKRTRRRKRRHTAASNISQPQVVKRPAAWLSTFSNLALLLAIFTIIFIAHKGIQSSRPQPIAPVQPASSEDASSSNITTQENEPREATSPANSPQDLTAPVPSPADTIVTQAVPAAEGQGENVVEEQSAKKDTAVKEKMPVAGSNEKVDSSEKVASYSTDPYTDSGPLDLDRRTLDDLKNTGKITDHQNPWNSGGQLDLDNENTRLEYSKNNYLSVVEDDK